MEILAQLVYIVELAASAVFEVDEFLFFFRITVFLGVPKIPNGCWRLRSVRVVDIAFFLDLGRICV